MLLTIMTKSESTFIKRFAVRKKLFFNSCENKNCPLNPNFIEISEENKKDYCKIEVKLFLKLLHFTVEEK